MQIVNFLDDEELLTIRKKFQKLDWSDGKETATGQAKTIKNNKQATKKDPKFQPILEIIAKKFFTGKMKNFVFPKNLVGVRANSYSLGESYGWHVDSAHMDRMRTDMSFTIFISDPEQYDGGELEMDERGRMTRVKLKAGQMVVYPTGVLHQVTEVTRGERQCIIGWIESFVPEEPKRELIIGYQSILNDLKLASDNELPPNRKTLDKMNQTYTQLIRTLTR